MRIEDLDPPRESPEATYQILSALETLNLFWDETPLYQSNRLQDYELALHALREQNTIFPCTCTRQQITDNQGIYPGTCARKNIHERDLELGKFSLRCKIHDTDIDFQDLLQGRQTQNLKSSVGDFILKRKDGLFAYQLAVVVDDNYQEITHVVRGIDLLDSTARQIHLQQLLAYPQLVYAHIPVIINEFGQKLSKQHHATPINLDAPSLVLYEALGYLQQNPDPVLKESSPSDILDWAINNWQIGKLQNLHQLSER